MEIKNKIYRKRLVDEIITKKLRSIGAVLIEGAKWCGKTTTGLNACQSVLYMQDPATTKRNIEISEVEPAILLEGKTPRLIDEWQLAPKLYDAIRFEIDKRNEFGQFIMTGSSTPVSLKSISHTGTGRISRILMRTMSLWESLESTGEVSFTELFHGNTNVKGFSDKKLMDIANLICRGGFPGSLDLDKKDALMVPYNYYNSIISREIIDVDNVNRDKEKIKRFMKSLSRNIATAVRIPTIIEDIKTYDNEKISDVTISNYITALRNIFVIEDLNAWNPNIRSKTSIRTTGTKYFVDPSIAVAALGLGPNDLINDLNTFGILFENLCVRDLKIYAEAIDGELYKYRDARGLECDAVMHLRNGKYCLIEIKLGGDKLIEDGAKTLQEFEKVIDTDKMNMPIFKMIITAVGDYAYKRKDGIIVTPISCLRV